MASSRTHICWPHLRPIPRRSSRYSLTVLPPMSAGHQTQSSIFTIYVSPDNLNRKVATFLVTVTNLSWRSPTHRLHRVRLPPTRVPIHRTDKLRKVPLCGRKFFVVFRLHLPLDTHVAVTVNKRHHRIPMYPRVPPIARIILVRTSETWSCHARGDRLIICAANPN